MVRYRMHIESRLGPQYDRPVTRAVRRLAHGAAGSGLLSPEPAAGISRVRRLGIAPAIGKTQIKARQCTAQNPPGLCLFLIEGLLYLLSQRVNH